MNSAFEHAALAVDAETAGDAPSALAHYRSCVAGFRSVLVAGGAAMDPRSRGLIEGKVGEFAEAVARLEADAAAPFTDAADDGAKQLAARLAALRGGPEGKVAPQSTLDELAARHRALRGEDSAGNKLDAEGKVVAAPNMHDLQARYAAIRGGGGGGGGGDGGGDGAGSSRGGPGPVPLPSMDEIEGEVARMLVAAGQGHLVGVPMEMLSEEELLMRQTMEATAMNSMGGGGGGLDGGFGGGFGGGCGAGDMGDMGDLGAGMVADLMNAADNDSGGPGHHGGSGDRDRDRDREAAAEAAAYAAYTKQHACESEEAVLQRARRLLGDGLGEGGAADNGGGEGGGNGSGDGGDDVEEAEIERIVRMAQDEVAMGLVASDDDDDDEHTRTQGRGRGRGSGSGSGSGGRGGRRSADMEGKDTTPTAAAATERAGVTGAAGATDNNAWLDLPMAPTTKPVASDATLDASSAKGGGGSGGGSGSGGGGGGGGHSSTPHAFAQRDRPHDRVPGNHHEETKAEQWEREEEDLKWQMKQAVSSDGPDSELVRLLATRIVQVPYIYARAR
jgi:hypothetical protein